MPQQLADDKALAAGDIVYLHEGTYTFTGGHAGTDWVCSSNDVWAMQVPETGTKGNPITWTVQGADDVVLDLDNAAPGFCFNSYNSLLAGSGTLGFINKKDGANDAQRWGCVESMGGDVDADGVVVDGVTCSVGTVINTTGLSSHICWRFDEGEGHVLQNTTCSGPINTGLYLHSAMHEDADDGILVQGNTFTSTRAAGGSTGVIIADTGSNNNTEPLVLINNTFDWTGATNCAGAAECRGLYLREFGGYGVVMNNRFNYFEQAIYFQDDLNILAPVNAPPLEDWWIVNNTFRGRGSVRMGEWPLCLSTAKVRNNIFSGFADFNFGACGHAGTPNTNRSAADEVTYSVCHGGTATCSSGGSITYSNTQTGDPLINTTSLAIGVGSSAIGNGTNDPLGQGANICSLTVNSTVIDCTVDYEGNARGAAWDIGADEYLAPGTPPSPTGLRGGFARGVTISRS